MQRQVEGESAAFSRHALQDDLAAQQTRQLAADRQPQSGAAVFAAGGAVGLLECLENHPLLVLRNADAGIADGKSDHRCGLAQRGMVAAPSRSRRPDLQGHLALRRKLERIGQQVLDDLLHAPLVRKDRDRQCLLQLDGKAQFLVVGHMAEGLLDETAQIHEGHFVDIRRHRARLDLGQIQDIVDEVQQIVARCINGSRVLDLLGAQVLLRVVAQLLRE